MFKFFVLIFVSIQLITIVRTNDDGNELVFVKDVDAEQKKNEEFKSSFNFKVN